MLGEGQCCKLFAVTAMGMWGRQSGSLQYLVSPHVDRHARDISFTVCYPHMPIGMLWIYRLLFVFLFVFLRVRRILCKGYLGRGWT